jgi:Ca-activated chloride channel family protein
MAELWRPDVFSTRVGNLKPGQAVLIRLTYVSDVDLSEHKLRVSFPTTMAPRYATSIGMDEVDAAMEADALNPPHVLSVPYGLQLSAEIDLGLALKSVGSPTHGVRVERGDGETWKVSLAAGKTEMNRNVVLEAELSKAMAASGVIEDGIDPAEHFAAVTFLPEFETSELGEVQPREIVFVLDCSGSMGGTSIEEAKRALSLCLKCLNEGDRFNICRFGSTYELMQPESTPYTQRTLDAAMAYVGRIDANLGGTELHEPLKSVLASGGSRQVRDIILLTDGQVSNEPAVIKMASTARGRARIFAFGIGPASSEFLVRGLAGATGGAAAFIAQNERIEDHVMRMFARIASPRIDAIDVTWQGVGGEHRGEVDMEPRQVGGLFDGEPLRIAARLRGDVPQQITLSAMVNGQRKTWTVPLTAGVARRSDDRIGLIGASWARQRLATLELAYSPVLDLPPIPIEAEFADEIHPSHAAAIAANTGRRNAIVELSRRYHILSKETTFIAIEHRSLEDRTTGKPEQRRVPVMLAKDWGGSAELLDEVGALYDLACAPMEAPAAAPPVAKKKRFLDRLRGCVPQVSLSRKWDEGDLAPPPAQAPDPMLLLLLRQAAEGWFEHHKLLDEAQMGGKPWDPAEARAKIETLTASLPKKLQQQILDTALVIRALNDCFPEQRELWIMAAKKALRWLKKVAPEVHALLEQPVPVK